VGVIDTNVARAQEVATASGTRAFSDYRDVLRRIDAATVAVPTERHRDITLECLAAGRPVLVEKPMARSLAEADAMIAAAAKAGVTFAVGHTERFNPAVAARRLRAKSAGHRRPPTCRR